MPLYKKKKESLTSKYISKFQMWFIAKGWYECKIEIEIKRELAKQVTASVESGHQRLLIQFTKL
jgi:hypothetical protein